MGSLFIAQRRERARRLAEEALRRIDPRAPATESGHMPTVNFLLAGAVALLFVGVAGGAWALPTGSGLGCYVRGQTSADGGVSPNIANNLVSYEKQTCEGSADSAGGVSIGGPVLFSQAGSSLAEVQLLGLGRLGAFARASATATPEQDGVLNLYAATANASAFGYWYDELTVGGTPNQDGLVMLRFSIDLGGQVSHSAGPNQGFISAGFRIDDQANYPDESILFVSSPGDGSSIIGFQPGTHLQVYGWLGATVFARAGRENVCGPTSCVPGPFHAEGSTTGDALHAAHYYIDVVTPGGSYATESGQNYETPVGVPEPAAWLVLASGLLALSTLAGPWRRRLGVDSEVANLNRFGYHFGYTE